MWTEFQMSAVDLNVICSYALYFTSFSNKNIFKETGKILFQIRVK
jgi:hypothetical protein